MLALIDGASHLSRRVKKVRTSHGEEGIELVTGQRLRFVARSTGSGRGFSVDLAILDESYNLGGEAVAALLPTMSARPNPQLWYASSTGMHSSEQLLRVHDRGIAGDSPRLAYFEWSADPALSLSDRLAWEQANPSLGIRITYEYIESERAAMGDAEFARERLGHWPEFDVEQIIDPAVWAALVDAQSRVTDPVVFAMDATPDRAKSSVAVAGRRSDGRAHVEIVDSRSGTAWVPGRAAELVKRWAPAAVMLDPTGAAGSWLAELSDLGIEPVLVGGREMGQACGAFYESVCEKRDIRHLDQEPLNSALVGARKRALGDAWAWHRRTSRTDISPLVAATLALYGLVAHGRVEAPTAPVLWV